jgi:hypothetical protein
MIERGVLSRSLPSQFDDFLGTTAAARRRSIFILNASHILPWDRKGELRATHGGETEAGNPQKPFSNRNRSLSSVISDRGPAAYCIFTTTSTRGFSSH